MDKSHIEHTVSLIENRKGHVVEGNVSLVHQVKQSARCGHEDINALFQSIYLAPLLNTPENHGVSDSRELAVSRETLSDLDRQFTRGSHHQRPDLPHMVVFLPLAVQMLKDGNGKGCRLSRTRLGTTQQILAAK